MPFIKYVGIYASVDVPRYQIGALERGTDIYVPDDVANDLLRQSANWIIVDPPVIPDGKEE